MRVEAFRNKEDKERFKRYLKKHKDRRLYPMFIIGCNTGLRVSDLAPLKVGDFRNKQYLIIKGEEKTNKKKIIKINKSISNVINEYYFDCDTDDYLFKSQKGGYLCVQSIWRLFKEASKKCGIKYNIGTHTMRKTFGKEVNRKYGIDVTQKMLGHDNQRDTLVYLGLEQEMLDKVIESIEI